MLAAGTMVLAVPDMFASLTAVAVAMVTMVGWTLPSCFLRSRRRPVRLARSLFCPPAPLRAVLTLGCYVKHAKSV